MVNWVIMKNIPKHALFGIKLKGLVGELQNNNLELHFILQMITDAMITLMSLVSLKQFSEGSEHTICY